jgi:hypothetical protein
MDSAIGQPVTGIGISYAGVDPACRSGYSLCAGYLCGVRPQTQVYYMPLVRK